MSYILNEPSHLNSRNCTTNDEQLQIIPRYKTAINILCYNDIIALFSDFDRLCYLCQEYNWLSYCIWNWLSAR